MAISQVVAGAYVGTYNSVATGYNDANGFELDFNSHAEEINDTDLYGGSLLDFVYRGGSMRMMFTGKVYAAGIRTPFWPWGSLGVIGTTAAPIGRLASNVAASMILTVVANTPAASVGPSTVTASKSILAPNSNLRLMFTTKSRNVPVQLVCLPTESGGTITYFTTT